MAMEIPVQFISGKVIVLKVMPYETIGKFKQSLKAGSLFFAENILPR